MKPPVFNYAEYERVVEENKRLLGLLRTILSDYKYPDDPCLLCVNNGKCKGTNCPEFCSGDKGYDENGKEISFKWTCEDWEYGTCPVMEKTPCNGCFDNSLSGFEWNGKGGAE